MLQLQNRVFVCIAPAVGVQSLMDATALISGSANYHIVQLNTFSNHLCSISCSCGIISPFTSLEPGSDSNVSTWWFHQLVECGVVLSPDGAIQLVTGDHHTVYPVVTKWCTTGATESQVVIIGGETGSALGNSDSNALPPPPPAFHISLCVHCTLMIGDTTCISLVQL